MRIAMWSGPRNLSTAMMYSFGQRASCAVWDEPFYAAYLAASGEDHPMGDAIKAAHETDPAAVAAAIRGPVPGEKREHYLKLMAHHMLPDFPWGWADGCTHVHLIRHPARVIASYGAKRDRMNLKDIGFPQQAAIFERFGGAVIDSHDIRADPEAALRGVCGAIGVVFEPAMLSWPGGGRAEDGVWAPHWYGTVHKSTGFAEAEGPLPELTGEAARVAEAATPYYERMSSFRLRVPA